MRTYIYSLVALALFTSSLVLAAPLKVALLSPAAQGEVFWGSVEQIAKEAAKDLHIDLKIYKANRNRLTILKQAREAIDAKTDYLLFANLQKTAPKLIQMADAAGVKCFIFNAPLHDKQRAEFGRPREKYPLWIGEMVPDDSGVGERLAILLSQHAKSLGLGNQQGVVEMLGVAGLVASNASELRIKGLNKAVKSDSDIILKQLVYGDWKRQLAQRKTRGLLARYPDIRVIWAANDPMALGVIDAFEASGLEAGKDALTVGVDWEKPALDAIVSGKLLASAGGHFLESAWALVLIHDYHHGKDFQMDPGISSRSTMSILTSDNIQKYLSKLGEGDWSAVDFSRFSKVLNPHLKSYPFNLEAVLQQL